MLEDDQKEFTVEGFITIPLNYRVRAASESEALELAGSVIGQSTTKKMEVIIHKFNEREVLVDSLNFEVDWHGAYSEDDV